MIKKLLPLLALCLMLASCASPCSVVWTEGAADPETGKAIHTLEILNAPEGTEWSLWFCQFRVPIQMAEGSPAVIEHINGTLYRIVPQESSQGESMVLSYTSNPLVNQCRAPEAFYLQKGNETPVKVEVKYIFQPCEDVKSFEFEKVALAVEDMVPALKKVEHLEGSTNLGEASGNPEIVEGQVPGWYRITINGDVKVEAADEDGAYYAGITIEQILAHSETGNVPNMIIEDWPDLAHRGLMLDVSRNFTKKENVLKLLDILAHYKANVLHLHFGDDEGWRIEIEGLPELTSYGAFRGIPTVDEDGTIHETNALEPSYSGSFGPADTDAPGNGFYSKADFVEILRYANERHIKVIPEFDTPGHSRASIKAMEKRFEHTGEDAYLLSEAADTSKYVSVQDYPDNAINVAIPSTYAFIEKVFDGLIALYAEAEAPLLAIHIGGDEVPSGAWKGSPACQALMEENGWTDYGMLKDYYINKVMDIAEEKGVKIAGWQEVAMHLQPSTFERLQKNALYTNMWSTSPYAKKDELTYQFANQGINVVLSNSSNAYMDFSYNRSKKERGHNWGGYVDERRSYSLNPYDIYKSVRWDDKGEMASIADASAGKTALTEEGKSHIYGVQGQLWAETIRNFDHVTYYLFPKLVGLLERGWNAEPAWAATTVSDDPAFTDAFNRYFSIIEEYEYPYYEKLGIGFHRN